MNHHIAKVNQQFLDERSELEEYLQKHSHGPVGTGLMQAAQDVKAEAGIKHDNEKPMLALIPPRALEEEGHVWTFGAKKYGNWNWKKGLAYTRIISAMLRHTLALMRGEDIDSESGRHHAAHIRCCAGMLLEFHFTGRIELDDRDKEKQ